MSQKQLDSAIITVTCYPISTSEFSPLQVIFSPHCTGSHCISFIAGIYARSGDYAVNPADYSQKKSSRVPRTKVVG